MVCVWVHVGCGPGAHSKACFHVPLQFPAATKSCAMARAMHTALSYLRELAGIVGTQAIATLTVLCVCYHSLLCRALGYTGVYMSEALPFAAADKPARAHAVYDDEETSPFWNAIFGSPYTHLPDPRPRQAHKCVSFALSSSAALHRGLLSLAVPTSSYTLSTQCGLQFMAAAVAQAATKSSSSFPISLHLTSVVPCWPSLYRSPVL